MAGAKTGVRRAVTIIGTLICAAGTGYFMQNILAGNSPEGGSVQVASVSPVQDVMPTDDTPERLISDLSQAPAPLMAPADPVSAAPLQLPMPEPQPIPELAMPELVMPEPPASAPRPEPLPDLPFELAALADQPVAPVPAAPAQAAPDADCEVKLYAVAVPAAMVDLALDAACKPEAQFTVHHNGMMVSGITDSEGLSSLSVPALSETSLFIVSFASGGSAVASVSVPELAEYDRAVVQWSGASGFQIHALEYGADYNQPGHVWEDATHDAARALSGEGGFLTLLGDPGLLEPHLAQVYTFPSRNVQRDGEIDLSLEAIVTEATCGRDVAAQVLQKTGDDRMVVRELSLAMPDCEAVGDFLVLKNMFDNLNIARN